MRPCNRRGQVHGRLARLENRQATRHAVPLAVIHDDGRVTAEPGGRVFASETDFLDATAHQDKPALLIRSTGGCQ